jgi:hypothetical protein
MNWRRGILLAAINLAIAAPLIMSAEHRDAAYVRDYYVPPKAAEASALVPNPVADPKNEGVSFSMCNMTDEFDWPERVVISANAPAFAITGWRRFCPAPWQIAGMLQLSSLERPAPSSMAAQREVDLSLSLLIPLQWFLVGAFPLTRPRKPWIEPGISITICTALSAALFLITRPHYSFGLLPDLGGLPAAFAGLVWFWWFGLLLWKLARFTWKWTARHLVRVRA